MASTRRAAAAGPASKASALEDEAVELKDGVLLSAPGELEQGAQAVVGTIAGQNSVRSLPFGPEHAMALPGPRPSRVLMSHGDSVEHHQVVLAVHVTVMEEGVTLTHQRPDAELATEARLTGGWNRGPVDQGNIGVVPHLGTPDELVVGVHG